MSDMSTGQVVAMLNSSSSNSVGSKKGGSWFEQMAGAWGDALNTQATRIVEQADKVAGGFDTPSEITELTAESLRMNFISNSAHTSLTAVSSGLETIARKQ